MRSVNRRNRFGRSSVDQRWECVSWFIVCMTMVAFAIVSLPANGQEVAKNSTRKIRPQPSETAARAGLSVAWRDSFQSAVDESRRTGKPLFWYVSTVPGTFMDRKVEIDRYMMAGPFSFPPIVDLLNDRFIPCRIDPNQDLAETYGLKPFDFVEPGVVVLSAEGDVTLKMDRLTTLHLPWLYERFVGVSGADQPRPMTMSAEAMPYYQALRDGRVDSSEIEMIQGDVPDSVESMLWAGRVAFRANHHEAARQWFERAAARDPQHPLAAKAAMEAEGLGPFVRGFEVFRDLPAAAYDAGLESPGSAAPADAYSESLLWRHAVDYLLGMQNRRGGYVDSDYDFGGTDSLPNVHVAVTSLVGLGLLEAQRLYPDYRKDEVQTAIDRCYAYVTDESNLNRNDRDEILWAMGYRLQFAAALVRLQRIPPEALESLVRDVESLQTDRGVWYHEYANPFVTATALQALADARDAGAQIQSEIVQRGLDALAADRMPNGAWPYASRGRSGRGNREVPVEAAAGRMPLCESALRTWQRSDDQRLAGAIETSFEHQEILNSALKYDDHTSRYAYGGFFFWYDMWGRSRAIVLLGDDQLRDQMLQRQRELVLSLPEVDGCFVDSHELGRSYGTAMALLCLGAGR